MKTLRPRSGGASFVACDGCYGPISGRVWIVPGLVIVFGTCSRCGSWERLADLADPKPGGRRGAPSGTCPACDNAR